MHLAGTLDLKEESLNKRDGALLIEEQRVADERERSTNALATADAVLKEAESKSETVEAHKVRAELELSERIEAIERKEDIIERREENAELREQAQDLRDKEQDDRDRVIIDRYQTLLRTEKRHANNIGVPAGRE
jgi:thioredoxin-like negative regulator of GroEL